MRESSPMSLEAKVSEILENILSLLSLEGSFEVTEQEDLVSASIETEDAGRLIGKQGENLSALQLIVNQILSKQMSSDLEFKKVVIDVENWKKSKEEDLKVKVKSWVDQVKTDKKELELEPMPAWQRRIIHLEVENVDGLSSESVGEGEERHLIIKPKSS